MIPSRASHGLIPASVYQRGLVIDSQPVGDAKTWGDIYQRGLVIDSQHVPLNHRQGDSISKGIGD